MTVKHFFVIWGTDNKIEGEGIDAIAEALKTNTTLTDLNLQGTYNNKQ